ncbi:MAG TPA: DoxX family protein [Candidatus Angelobacter sp.]|nr:DoxX family protein [Candidatus Angelobacter sp.]
MDKLLALGRLFLGIPMLVFGVQHFMYPQLMASLVPAWIPGHLFWAYFVGVALLAAGISILLDRFTQWAATLLGIMILSFVLLIHLPMQIEHHWKRNEVTNMFTDLGLSGGALLLAKSARQEERRKAKT